ncbi:uncharacterized protein LOC124162463 isoform X2 [Ischnura elegans]|uniref:uncharacterized protein LOC124162463 isoform X2 n=1 Tax=Ischnura elegans TaxID=197161 RepID=UPI001ED8AB62|nr:uncharacterized protein LOC124162463 isoform X2 [Ischnura elegans]
MSQIGGCSWKPLVHPSYWNSVTSHDVCEDGSAVFVSTKEGAFIKFHKGVIESSCRTGFCNVETIEQFFSYHPYKRYYLLWESDKIVIISEELKVHTGLEKYEIEDFIGEGRPQIQLKPLDSTVEPFIVDLSSPHQGTRIVTNQSKGFLSSRLQLKLKETKNVLMKFVEEAERKKRLRVETLQRLALNYPVEHSKPSAGLQHFFGDAFGENVHPSGDDSQPLQLLHHWQVTINERLTLGLAIRNSSDRIIHNVKVFLDESSSQRVCYSMRRLNCSNMDEVLSRFHVKTPEVFNLSSASTFYHEEMDRELPPGKGCILMVVLPFPEFVWSSRKRVFGRLSYCVGFPDDEGDAYTQELPFFETTARGVLDDSLLSQDDVHKKFLYAMSIISVSEKIMLAVTMGTSSRTVEELLSDGVGFSLPSAGNNFFVHSGNGCAVLAGSLIQVIQSADGCEMHVYARSAEILRLLVYSILEACPGSWRISCGHRAKQSDAVSHPSCMTLGDCSDALSQEIHCIIYNLSKWKEDDSSHTLSTDVKSYVDFRREVIAIQRKTDAIFSSFERSDTKSGQIVYH